MIDGDVSLSEGAHFLFVRVDMTKSDLRAISTSKKS